MFNPMGCAHRFASTTSARSRSTSTPRMKLAESSPVSQVEASGVRVRMRASDRSRRWQLSWFAFAPRLHDSPDAVVIHCVDLVFAPVSLSTALDTRSPSQMIRREVVARVVLAGAQPGTNVVDQSRRKSRGACQLGPSRLLKKSVATRIAL
jgi:hypothetical protein